MVHVVAIAAYRRIYWLRLIGLAATWRCVLHSLDKPGELWLCRFDTTHYQYATPPTNAC